MEPIIVGVDPSSKKIAMAIHVPGRDVELRIINLFGTVLSRKCARAFTVFRKLIKELRKQGDVYVIIEAPVVGVGGPKPTIMQSKINGALQAGGVIAKARMLEDANVQSWKKTVVGKGNASKSQVAEWLQRKHPELFFRTGNDQDLIDACAILEYGKYVTASITKGR